MTGTYEPNKAATVALEVMTGTRFCGQGQHWPAVAIGGKWRVMNNGKARRWICLECMERASARRAGAK